MTLTPELQSCRTTNGKINRLYLMIKLGTQMMLYMHEMDMTMMATSYEWNSLEEVEEVSEEVETEEEGNVEETVDLARQQEDHSTEYW
jgi:hypothetical protein